MMITLLFTLLTTIGIQDSNQIQNTTEITPIEVQQKGVTILSKIERCIDIANAIDIQYIQLEIINSNSTAVEVKFQVESWMRGVCSGCDMDSEFSRTIQLASKSKQIAGCAMGSDPLRFFYAFTDPNVSPSRTEGFNLNHIQVNLLQPANTSY